MQNQHNVARMKGKVSISFNIEHMNHFQGVVMESNVISYYAYACGN